MAPQDQLATLRQMIDSSGATLHGRKIGHPPAFEKAAEPSSNGVSLSGPRWFRHHPRWPSCAGTFLAIRGIPRGRLISLASSRLPRSAPTDSTIGKAIRTFFRGLMPSDVIVSVAGTTLDEALVDGAKRWSQPIIRFLPVPSRNGGRRHWLELNRARPDNEFNVYYDPSEFPDRDALLLASCQHVKILSVRSGGNLERLLTGGEAIPGNGTETRLLLVDKGLTQPATRSRLGANGIGDWYLVEACCPTREQRDKTLRDPESPDGDPRIVPVHRVRHDLLSHWTRPRHASAKRRDRESPWSRIWELQTGLPGCLDRLHEILLSQYLRGGGRLARGGRPVCSFTEVPLESFPKHRKFRPHLARWDFELAGIAISKTALQREGARRVRYLPQAEIDRLAVDEQIWCQPADGKIDWSTEREWRFEGDLNLRRFGPDELVVFVPDHDSALALRDVCRWTLAYFDSSRPSGPPGKPVAAAR